MVWFDKRGYLKAGRVLFLSFKGLWDEFITARFPVSLDRF
jgi:hypothetical protein